MRAIIQRVTKASVTVEGEVISSIGRGLCVLLGISRDDTHKEIEYMIRKILNLRVFDDNGQRWRKNVMDKQLEVLCISQFTLYNILKGNKLDFHLAMGGEDSQRFYEEFIAQMKKSYKPDVIKDGQFGAYMQVDIQNDGPVTIDLESPTPKPQQQKQKSTANKDKKAQPSSSSQNEQNLEENIEELSLTSEQEKDST